MSGITRQLNKIKYWQISLRENPKNILTTDDDYAHDSYEVLRLNGHNIGHFRDVLPSQSLDLVRKTHTTTDQ